MGLLLRGKSVLITGASRGVGAATAKAFAEKGSDVHLAACSTEAMQALSERLRAPHQVSVIAHTVDVRKSDDLHRLARETAGVDILVNNARDIPGGPLENWRCDMALCVGAEGIRPYQPSCLVHADMKSRNHGVIVNIIGAAGERFNYDYITGSAGNAALMAFTKSLGGKGCAMTFASLELIPSRLKPTASFTWWKPAAERAGRWKPLRRIDEKLSARARRQTMRNGRHDHLSGIRSFRLHQWRDRHTIDGAR